MFGIQRIDFCSTTYIIQSGYFVQNKHHKYRVYPFKLIEKQKKNEINFNSVLTPTCSSSLSSSLELGSIILIGLECVYLTAANSNSYELCKSKSAHARTRTHEHTTLAPSNSVVRNLVCLLSLYVVYVSPKIQSVSTRASLNHIKFTLCLTIVCCYRSRSLVVLVWFLSLLLVLFLI